MMKFRLPDFDLSNHTMVFAGGRKRHATATATCFVDDDTILVASFLNKKIYLVDITNNGFNIISSVDTNYYPDLIDYKDGLVIATGNGFGAILIYRLVDNHFTFIKDIVKPELLEIHGCRIIDQSNIIVTNTSHNNNRGIFFMNIDTKEMKQFNNFEFYPKDVLIVGDKLLVPSSSSKPSSVGQMTEKGSILYLFKLNTMEIITKLEFFGQTDAICLTGENGFITLQAQDSLLHFTLKNNIFKIIKTIPGFSFPHGISSNNDKVIVTNYGDNSVDIIPLNELVDNY